MKLLILLFSLCLFAVQSLPAKKMSDREHAGFIGPVKSVYMEHEFTERNYGDRLLGKHCRGLTDVYDERGRLIQHSVYAGSCGSDEIRESYTYTLDGSRITSSNQASDKTAAPPPAGIKVGPDGDTGSAKETFRYDDAGRLAESSLVRSNGNLIDKTIYQYDSMGRLIETRSQDADGEVYASHIYKYSGNNKVPSGYSYIDFRGQVHETTTYSDYKFNPQGDWIRRKVKTEQTLDRRQTLIETRTIEYYATAER